MYVHRTPFLEFFSSLPRPRLSLVLSVVSPCVVHVSVVCGGEHVKSEEHQYTRRGIHWRYSDRQRCAPPAHSPDSAHSSPGSPCADARAKGAPERRSPRRKGLDKDIVHISPWVGPCARATAQHMPTALWGHQPWRTVPVGAGRAAAGGGATAGWRKASEL